jgi:alcohol dehydrogenase class IV
MTRPAPARLADWRFDYRPGAIRFGAGATEDLAQELARLDADRALVVCGQTVGASEAVMDPVRSGLEGHLAGVFAETTPEKRLATAVAGARRFAEVDADCLVAVGGGSSLDVATAIRLLVGDDRSPDAIGRAFAERGTVAVPDASLPPFVGVPTTLAGADLSSVAGLTAHPDGGLVDEPIRGGLSHPSLFPSANVYDPALVASTPTDVLAASAMNGFDKGLEAIYAERATPITDATASAGLSHVQDGLGYFESEAQADQPTEALASLLTGIILVQYGCYRPEGHLLSVIHAFGHALSGTTDLHQGVAHGVVAPHVLASLFDAGFGRPEALAAAFGVADRPDSAAAVVEEVASVRDGLGLPSRLADVDGPDPEEFEAVAEAVLADSFMQNGPAGYSPSTADIVAVLEAAW